MREFVLFSVFLIWVVLALKNCFYALQFIICLLAIDFNKVMNINDFFIYIKILFLASSLLCLVKYGFKTKCSRILYLFLCFLFVSQLFATYTDKYSIFTAVQSTMSFILVFLLYSISFPDREKTILMRNIQYLPIFCSVFGLLLLRGKAFGSDGRFGGLTTSTNLAFICSISVLCLVCNYYKKSSQKILYLLLADILICASTLTRGALLFCFVLLLPLVVQYLSRLNRKQIIFLLIAVCFLAVLIFCFKDKLLSRMFTKDGSFNSSGRFEAWNYILGLNKDGLFGKGYGKLNTLSLTGIYIDHFNSAHNEFVRILYESGWLGLIIMILIFWNIFRLSFSLLSIPKKQKICIVIAFILYSFVDNTMSNTVFFAPFMLVLSCAERVYPGKVIRFKYR